MSDRTTDGDSKHPGDCGLPSRTLANPRLCVGKTEELASSNRQMSAAQTPTASSAAIGCPEARMNNILNPRPYSGN